MHAANSVALAMAASALASRRRENEHPNKRKTMPYAWFAQIAVIAQRLWTRPMEGC